MKESDLKKPVILVKLRETDGFLYVRSNPAEGLANTFCRRISKKATVQEKHVIINKAE
jgi:hypothetical protein